MGWNWVLNCNWREHPLHAIGAAAYMVSCTSGVSTSFRIRVASAFSACTNSVQQRMASILSRRSPDPWTAAHCVAIALAIGSSIPKPKSAIVRGRRTAATRHRLHVLSTIQTALYAIMPLMRQVGCTLKFAKCTFCALADAVSIVYFKTFLEQS